MRPLRLMGMIGALALMVSASAAQAGDLYSGCSKDRNSKVRPSSVVVNAAPSCRATETVRVWSETGPEGAQGPAGPQGPTGPQGAPGVTSCHPEEFPGNIPASTFGVINMSCASGHATGSGALWTSPFAGANNGKVYLYPTGDNSWTCLPYNDTASASSITCFLQCCS